MSQLPGGAGYVSRLLNSPNAPDLLGWVRASERLPDEEVQVICYCEDEDEERFQVVSYRQGGQWVVSACIEFVVTHWRPLPEPPPADEVEIQALLQWDAEGGQP